MKCRISLEPAAVKVADDNSKCPFIFQLPPSEGRKVLEQAQSSPITTYPVNISYTVVNTGKFGCVKVYAVVPKQCCEPLNLIYYIHGAGFLRRSLLWNFFACFLVLQHNFFLIWHNPHRFVPKHLFLGP
ncbi:MAG: hypothetical protein PUC65_16435 [Clostridiales bacterium]|nr:hypothetical protein [Clostridiales bacterium]